MIGLGEGQANGGMLYVTLAFLQEQEAAAEAEDTVQRLAAKKTELETQIGVGEIVW